MEERIIKDINDLLAQLFQKMKEAGYEWDAEKKELKKIEQGGEEDEIRLKHILRLLDVKDDKKYLLMFGLNSLQDLEKDIAWLKSLKDKLQPQQKQEWSKEDVNFIEATIGLLNLVTPIDAASWGKSRLDCVDWLKSLRPQSTWKPSEEQMEALDGICSYIRNKADWEISQDMVSDLYKLSEQLKKLKE